MKKKNNTESFEDLLKKLDKIVTKLESGTLSLEESLTKFKEGMHLTKIGQKILKEAEQQVKILIEEKENTYLDNFDIKNKWKFGINNESFF